MKKKFFKFFGSFLTAILLFVQVTNVSAYDTEVNISFDIDGYQNGFISEENYVLLTNDLQGKNATVSQQYIEISEEEYKNINAKLKEIITYSNEHKNSMTDENLEQIKQMQADAEKLIPIYNDSNWTALTLTEENVTATGRNGQSTQGDKYNVPLPKNITYMVSWTKVTIGDTDYYQYFLYCCKEVKVYKCEIIDNIYYGKDGQETTKEKYEEECTNKVCEIKDGKYYGKDGSEVDEKTYKEQCVNYCKIVNGVYYDNEGNEVDKATFDKACGNPKTGITNYYLIGGSFIVLSGLGYALLKNKKLFSK